MEKSIVIAGFGGQGVLFAGQVLAYAALAEGKEVTWFPSYGPEMRGGTAHCTVIISDEAIGAPLVNAPDVVIAMNTPSVQKYAAKMTAGAIMLINASLAAPGSMAVDATTHWIPVNQIAQNAGAERAANVAMLGALLAVSPILPLQAVADAISDHLPARHKDLLPANLLALETGYAYARNEPKLVT
ncbi:MAG: 2-oxoacid:acceptor oxidoreductase family protein [Caldilineaceae bacterium]